MPAAAVSVMSAAGRRMSAAAARRTRMNAPAEEAGTTLAQDGIALAWRRLPGRQPTVVFLSGFASDMTGTKAAALAAWCAARGQAYLRFDYAGHGASGGDFAD